MQLSNLKIGNLISEFPIIQGGMSVKVSNASLSAAVANAGGIGLIGGTGITVEEFVVQIRKARELTKGIVGVNVMVAIQNFLDIVKSAIQEKIDLIVFGAGFSKDVFTLCAPKGIPVVPVVSSVKAAKLAEKLGAAAIIVEGRDAGGHLGTDKPVELLIPEIKAAVNVPVIAAGGLTDGKDIAEMVKL
jgi:NAD(P)H-dependent flavin oxidoreductase YrpB (nitropropane dioxygenase family)